MENGTFYTQVSELLNALFLSTGYQLDARLTGYSIADAVHLNIDPAMEAIVRTEHRISPRMMVDLRELVNVSPPIDDENVFITFTADSAQFLGGNASAFGIHFARVHPPLEEQNALDNGVFVPGAQVTVVYRLIVFLRTPAGEVSLARTGAALGLDDTGRLVAYQTFQFDPGLTVTRHAPSSLTDADTQVMLYIFLTLSVFLMANQGESRVRWENDRMVVVG